MKNFNFMRLTKYALILGVAVFVMGLTPVHADTIVINPGATFSDGSALSGSINFDPTSGLVTSASIMIGSTSYTVVAGQAGAPGEFVLLLTPSSTNADGFPAVMLVFSTATGSLIGQTNLTLCTAAAPCDGDVTAYSQTGETIVGLTSGSASVPEPSTYLLLGSGLLGLGLLRRKRLVTNA